MAMEIRDRPQENNHSGSWVPRVGDGRADRYRHHASEGKPQLFSHADALEFLFLLCCRLNAELVGVPNISGYQCLLLLKYRFALSGIKSAAVLLSMLGCLCVLDQASDLINPAAWTA